MYRYVCVWGQYPGWVNRQSSRVGKDPSPSTSTRSSHHVAAHTNDYSRTLHVCAMYTNDTTGWCSAQIVQNNITPGATVTTQRHVCSVALLCSTLYPLKQKVQAAMVSPPAIWPPPSAP